MMDFKLLLQIIGVVLGLLYLYLEMKANVWLWVVGIIMPAVHAVLYFKSGLYADFGMQIYYILAGIWGLGAWLFYRKKSGSELPVSRTPARLWPLLSGIVVILLFSIYLFLSKLTDSSVPFWDALTTALSIVALWMLSRKFIEQWLVWFAVDVITVGLYIYKGIPLTACLYAVYSVLAIVGYRKWLRTNAVRLRLYE